MRIEGDDFVYEGKTNKNGEPHGKGKVTWDDGDIYEGEFYNGDYHGVGKLIFEDGEIYEGEFKKGFMCGNGQITYPNGSVQYGVWEDDTLVKEIGWKKASSAKAAAPKPEKPTVKEQPAAKQAPVEPTTVFVKPDPKELSKEFLRGYDLAKSSAEREKKAAYDEGYKKGKSEGWSSGYDLAKSGAEKDKKSAYDEGYKKGKSEGWSDGYKSGKASSPTPTAGYASTSTQSSSSGAIKRNGSNGLYNKSYYDPTTKFKHEKRGKLGGGNNYYEGEYEYWSYGGYDVPHGRGKRYLDGKCVFDGFFVMGSREGYGWEKDEDGDIYEGNFSDNLRHGLGRLVKKSGIIVEGIFEKGKTDGYPVVVTYPNGNVFEGRVQGNSDYKYFISGTMRYSDGGVFTGSWGGYHNCWQNGKYTKGNKTYEGSWSDDFVASRVTLTENGKKTEIEKQRIK